MKRIVFILLIAIMYVAGCSQTSEPKELDISGRYQSDNYGMILLLEHYYKQVSATIEWTGYSTTLEGHFDSKNNQVIMSGNYFGSQNISFNLFYKDNSLAGQFVYNGQYSPISFKFVNLLKHHNQGGLGNESY